MDSSVCWLKASYCKGRKFVVGESGGVGKVDQWSDGCSSESSGRKSKADEAMGM